MLSVEKPGSPEELVHSGVKGMRWGVRKERGLSTRPRKKRSTGKKVALGVGAAAVAAGGIFVALKLGQTGNVPISSVMNSTKKAADGLEFLNNTGMSPAQLARARELTAELMKIA